MHHANLIVGNKEWAFSVIPAEYQIAGQDVSIKDFDRLSIKDVRILIQDTQSKAILQKHRVFIVFATSIPTDAQHALLKLCEDPNDGVVLYLIISDEAILLPTLRSRFHLVSKEYREIDPAVFENFLIQNYNKRLMIIAEKIQMDDFPWTDALLAGYEQHACKNQDPMLIADVLFVRTYWNASGSSKKMLLEHLALSL